jgi:hypothetical protein
LREHIFWAAVARALVRRERPQLVLLQRVPLESGAAPTLARLETALDALGVDWRPWP